MATSNKGKGRTRENSILFRLQRLPDSSEPADLGNEGWGTEPSRVVHHGVICKGPLCKDIVEPIKGVRYHCSLCPETDFCDRCVRESTNDHDRAHAMFECPDVAIFTDASKINPEQLVDFERFTGGGPLEYLTLQDRVDEKLTNGRGNGIPGQGVVRAKRVRRQSGIIKHDPEVIVKVMLCKITEYHHQEEEFSVMSRSGIAATRLIELQPGRKGEKLQCTLKLIGLNSLPPFEALLCTSKKDTYNRAEVENMNSQIDGTLPVAFERYAIYIGDRYFLGISIELHDALQALRSSNEVRTLWVDQICVDQDNLPETKFQRRATGLIYHQATSVIVWAGEKHKHTCAVFGLIEQLAHRCNCADDSLPTPKELDDTPEIEPQPVGSDEWQSLAQFLPGQILKRGWRYHEALLAHHAVLKCGEYQTDWWKATAVARMLSQPGWTNAPWLVRLDDPLSFE